MASIEDVWILLLRMQDRMMRIEAKLDAAPPSPGRMENAEAIEELLEVIARHTGGNSFATRDLLERVPRAADAEMRAAIRRMFPNGGPRAVGRLLLMYEGRTFGRWTITRDGRHNKDGVLWLLVPATRVRAQDKSAKPFRPADGRPYAGGVANQRKE